MKSIDHSAIKPFPPLSKASDDGLLAVGGDLSAQRLIYAYSEGIFPWFSDEQPILWWSPDPRCVLFPAEFRASRSLKKSIRKKGFTVTVDTAFEAVIRACAAPRSSDPGTWITHDMRVAYTKLHELDVAHSVEVWQAGQLVGGLYGVLLGSTFFGESMFSRVSDASKTAFKALCEQISGLKLIDGQVTSAHLISLGAIELPRSEFVQQMKNGLQDNVVFELQPPMQAQT